MKYISYLIFFAFIAALLFFLKNALEPKHEPVHITGSQMCNECHGLRNIGDQMTPWKSSKHSGAYTVLFSTKAIDFNKTNGLASPEKEEKCLKCHSTEYMMKGTPKGQFFNITEGVGCESCHGAGSEYSSAEIMKEESSFIRSGGVKGDEKTCLKCHNAKGNKEKTLKEDVCPFQPDDFEYKSAFEKIKHPLSNEFKK